MVEPRKTRLRSRLGQHAWSRRNIYISAEDLTVWAAAQQWADDRGVSLSSLIAEALDAYLRTSVSDRNTKD